MKKAEKKTVLTRTEFVRTQIHAGVGDTQCAQQVVGSVSSGTVYRIDARFVGLGHTDRTRTDMHIM